MFPFFRLKKKKIREGTKDSRASTPGSLAQGSPTELYFDFFFSSTSLHFKDFKGIPNFICLLQGIVKRETFNPGRGNKRSCSLAFLTFIDLSQVNVCLNNPSLNYLLKTNK